jgi:hypothetical protein
MDMSEPGRGMLATILRKIISLYFQGTESERMIPVSSMMLMTTYTIPKSRGGSNTMFPGPVLSSFDFSRSYRNIDLFRTLSFLL